jgi:hypothetical protein
LRLVSSGRLGAHDGVTFQFSSAGDDCLIVVGDTPGDRCTLDATAGLRNTSIPTTVPVRVTLKDIDGVPQRGVNVYPLARRTRTCRSSS